MDSFHGFGRGYKIKIKIWLPKNFQGKLGPLVAFFSGRKVEFCDQNLWHAVHHQDYISFLDPRSLTARPWKKNAWKITFLLGPTNFSILFRGELLNFRGCIQPMDPNHSTYGSQPFNLWIPNHPRISHHWDNPNNCLPSLWDNFRKPDEDKFEVQRGKSSNFWHLSFFVASMGLVDLPTVHFPAKFQTWKNYSEFLHQHKLKWAEKNLEITTLVKQKDTCRPAPRNDVSLH